MVVRNKMKSAVVIGAGIAGLTTAQVLSEYFNEVIVIEKDQLPEGAYDRKYTPQSRHTHTLLLAGKINLEKLFPGLEVEMLSLGAVKINLTRDLLIYNKTKFIERFSSDRLTFACTRSLLEWTIRNRLVKNNGITFKQSYDVVGLLTDTNNSKISGVEIVSLQNNSEAEIITADLIVDASGRSSKAPDWLKKLGFQGPEETEVNSFLGYATRYYSIPENFKDWKWLVIRNNAPSMLRNGTIYPIEGNRWMVTLAGALRDYPPKDEEGFLEFTRSLRHPLLYEAIKEAAPLSDIEIFRRTENRFRHYEAIKNGPDNFIVIGDAACAFNPVYGQGMSAAVLGAITLNDVLENNFKRTPDLKGLAKDFQKRLARTNKNIWLLATGEDSRISAKLKTSPQAKVVHWYLKKVLLFMEDRRSLFEVFIDVAHLTKPPSALFHPRIIAAVLVCLIKNRK